VHQRRSRLVALAQQWDANGRPVPVRTEPSSLRSYEREYGDAFTPRRGAPIFIPKPRLDEQMLAIGIPVAGGRQSFPRGAAKPDLFPRREILRHPVPAPEQREWFERVISEPGEFYDPAEAPARRAAMEARAREAEAQRAFLEQYLATHRR